MFDTTIVRPTRYIDRHITTHEHRAPTDHSVKLLAEMEKAIDGNFYIVTKDTKDKL